MKKLPAVFDLVVMNHEVDATMYRVQELGVREVGVIDATIEDKNPNQRIQWVDVSMVQAPTVGQLAGFNS
ncbi:hypothetical protein [Malikia spinosa]|uniref:hypothetical protein n=1 Tax=Malikia spinosa TaxID=86180 RepID=UPI002FDB082A